MLSAKYLSVVLSNDDHTGDDWSSAILIDRNEKGHILLMVFSNALSWKTNLHIIQNSPKFLLRT